MRGARAGTDLRLVRRLWPYLAREGWRLWAAVALYPLSAACVAAPPLIIQRIFDDVVAAGRPERLPAMAALLGLMVLCEWGAGFAAEVLMGLLGQRAMARLREDLFARLQTEDARTLETTPQGRILTRLTSDVEALAELFSTGAITLVSDVMTLVAVVGMMVYLSPRLTLLSFAVMPPVAVTSWICQIFARDAFRRIRAALSSLNSFLGEHIQHMGVVQVFGQQRRVGEEFDALGRAYRAANRQAIFFDAGLFALIEAVGTVSVAALIGWGAGGIAAGKLTAGVLVAFIQYIRRFFVPLRDVTTKFTVLQSALAAAERVVAALEATASVTSPRAGYRPAAGAQISGVAFEAVDFAYDLGRGAQVLSGLTLSIARGERVALVGATGAGKSTLLRLLGRFYDVQAGSVAVGGVDVRQWDLTALRRSFGWVLQDTHLFSGTLRDNLALRGDLPPARVEEAVALLGLGDWVAGLPGGLDHPVGEGGANFSSGQRQLLAMIRALAIDPEILLLDEATSNIDTETEARLQAALGVLLAGRTAVVVAHRLSTVESMDRIVAIGDGRVLEAGTHGELLAAGGFYSRQVRGGA